MTTNLKKELLFGLLCISVAKVYVYRFVSVLLSLLVLTVGCGISFSDSRSLPF